MNRKVLLTLFVIVGLFAPMAGAPVANAAVPQAATTGMVDVWVIDDLDQNGYFSAGDIGLSGAFACVAKSNWTSCVGTDYGDTWWEDLPATGGYSTWVIPQTVVGYSLRSIRCQETGSMEEYTDCRYNLEDWSVRYKLNGGKRINIFFAVYRP